VLKTVDWLTLAGVSPLKGQAFSDPVGGQPEAQRYNWRETVNAGTTVNMLELTHSPFQDAVLMYSSGPTSTEAVTILIDQTNTRTAMPLGLQVGPRGGGQIRVSGGISVTATALNNVGGFADIEIWIIPGAMVQHVPPISAFDFALPQAVPTFLSPDAASSGWCPPQRPVVSFMAMVACILHFVNPAGSLAGAITFAPGTANRELQFIHPPMMRLRVTNNTGAPGGVIATWHRP
jgi:hypothetical protein